MLTHRSGQGYSGMAPLLNKNQSDVLVRKPGFSNSAVKYSWDLPPCCSNRVKAGGIEY